jgi:hypothetical protein
MFRLTVNQPVCLGVSYQSLAPDQIIITVRQMRVHLYGARSLMRRHACNLKILQGIASRTHGHILLSDI